MTGSFVKAAKRGFDNFVHLRAPGGNVYVFANKDFKGIVAVRADDPKEGYRLAKKHDSSVIPYYQIGGSLFFGGWRKV